MKRENLLECLIGEVLKENRYGYGSNKLYEDVSFRYCKIKGRTKKLSKSLFYTHLGEMKERDLVDKRGSNTKVEYYLTELGQMQIDQHAVELPGQKDKTQLPITDNNIPKELQALYALILYFNHGIAYRVYTKDALENILMQFGLSMSSLISSGEAMVKSEGADIKQVIFRSPKEDAIVFKDIFLRSDIHERGTVQYRCMLRGITCESVLENRNVRAFRHFGFTSDDIRGALEALCTINVLKPMGSLGLTVADEVIYKIDKSLFDFMFALHLLNGYDIFDKMESLMTEIWSKIRPPTDDEKEWLCFIYGSKETSRIINNAYESRNKITNGENMKSYISKIRRNNKEKLVEINKKVAEINEEITRAVDFMKWVQESHKTTIERHKALLKNVDEIIYPDFFSKILLKPF